MPYTVRMILQAVYELPDFEDSFEYSYFNVFECNGEEGFTENEVTPSIARAAIFEIG